MLENIRSKYILEKIFDYLKNKRKLKIIKCNKKILDDLNISKEDFQIYKTIKEFNQKYSTNIEDIDIKELNLEYKNLNNNGLECLTKIKFKNLKSLDLGCTHITDIKFLENLNLENLEQLHLDYNKITNIQLLENLNLQQLKDLDVCNTGF